MNNYQSGTSDVFEYIITVNLHEDLQQRILYLRKLFNEEFSVTEHLSKPQILLVRFTQREVMEAKIIRRLLLISMASQPFKMEFSGFDSIPSHTIFITVSWKTFCFTLQR